MYIHRHPPPAQPHHPQSWNLDPRQSEIMQLPATSTGGAERTGSSRYGAPLPAGLPFTYLSRNSSAVRYHLDVVFSFDVLGCAAAAAHRLDDLIGLDLQPRGAITSRGGLVTLRAPPSRERRWQPTRPSRTCPRIRALRGTP